MTDNDAFNTDQGAPKKPKGLLGRLSKLRLNPLRRNQSVTDRKTSELVAPPADEAEQALPPETDLDTSELARLCMNCGTPLGGPYCQACGQKHDDIRRPMWSFIKQVLDDVISTDSRMWRTVLILSFIPGRLSRDYNDGKRSRFLPPLRLYLITTILFFFTLNITDTAVVDIQVIPDKEEIEEYKARQLEEMADSLAMVEDGGQVAFEALQASGLLRTEVDFNREGEISNSELRSLIMQRDALKRVMQNTSLPEDAREDIEDRLEDLQDAIDDMEEQVNEREEEETAAAIRAGLQSAITEMNNEFANIGGELSGLSDEEKEQLKKSLTEGLTGLQLDLPPPPSPASDKEAQDKPKTVVQRQLGEIPAPDPTETDGAADTQPPAVRFDMTFDSEEPEVAQIDLEEAETEDPDSVIVSEGDNFQAELGQRACTDFALSEDFPYRACFGMFVLVENERRDPILPEHVNEITEKIEADDGYWEDKFQSMVVGFVRVIQDPKGFNKLFNDQLPWAMIVLIPIFALLLRMMHWGGNRFYMNQIIFALHFHSFLFVFLIALVMAAPILGAELLGELYWIISSLYLIIALKVGQKQGWFKSFFKAGFVYVPYFSLMMLTMMFFLAIGLEEA